MTRFLLPLQNAVDLVLFALIDGQDGTIYVRKSPACTMATLADALCKIFKYKKGWGEVGIRAGEKMHETLISYEESIRVIDHKDYYSILPQSQGLDYNRYLLKWKKVKKKDVTTYTSENTTQLNVNETCKVLMTIPEIQEELKRKKL